MKSHEPPRLWLPSTEQIMSAPERAILAALDATLELTIRVLKAEHVDLLTHGRLSRHPDYEPFTANLLPTAEATVICAEHLRRLLGEYLCLVNDLLSETKNNYRQADDDPDDDISF